MSEAQVMAQLHADYIASMTGNVVTVSPVVEFGGLIGLVSVFFFIIVFGLSPVIEWIIEQLFKAVDKVHDILH